jgi:hypothetical protein
LIEEIVANVDTATNELVLVIHWEVNTLKFEHGVIHRDVFPLGQSDFSN